MADWVECHSGYEYAERPVALHWEGDRLEIEEVLDRWQTPGSKCFRVRTGDGQIFELYYSESLDEWSIHQP
jgi:hypothetical protein